jgi:uncharacterized protein (DUF433 family)
MVFPLLYPSLAASNYIGSRGEVSAQHITKTPGVCGGRACTAGHRIRVMDIVVLHEMHEMSPEEIAYQYPSITLAGIHAALAYYLDNRQEIEDEFRKEDE